MISPPLRSLSIRVTSPSSPIPIPGHTTPNSDAARLRKSVTLTPLDDDDVFLVDQENLPLGSGQRRTFGQSRFLFPSLAGGSPGVCVHSPRGRRPLHQRGVDSSRDLKLLGRGSFGSVILGCWKGETTSSSFGTFTPVYYFLLQVSAWR